MLPAQDVSVFLNNALKASHMPAQIDGEAALPDQGRDMPDQVSGHFVDLTADAASEIQTAWKKVIIFNETQVLYTFTFDAPNCAFQARKR
jgi:hypothetical protein